MANVMVKLNLRGINRLMTSDSVQGEVDRVGRGIAARAGSDFEYRSRRHRWTARGFVSAANAAGARAEARDKVLTRAVGGI